MAAEGVKYAARFAGLVVKQFGGFVANSSLTRVLDQSICKAFRALAQTVTPQCCGKDQFLKMKHYTKEMINL